MALCLFACRFGGAVEASALLRSLSLSILRKRRSLCNLQPENLVLLACSHMQHVSLQGLACRNSKSLGHDQIIRRSVDRNQFCSRREGSVYICRRPSLLHPSSSNNPQSFVTLHPPHDVYPFATQLRLAGRSFGLCTACCRPQVNLVQHQYQHLTLDFSLFLPLLDPDLDTQLCNFCCCYHHYQLCFQHCYDHNFVGNSYWQDGLERLRKEGRQAVFRYSCRCSWY